MKRFCIFLFFITILSSNSISQPIIKEFKKAFPSSFGIFVDSQTYKKIGKSIDAYKHAVEVDGISSYIVIDDWKNPDETIARSKLVIFNYLPEFDWVVGSSSYLDELYAPLRTIRTLILATAGLTFLLVLPLSHIHTLR